MIVQPLVRSMLYPAPPIPVPSPPPAPLGEVHLPLPGGGYAVAWAGGADAPPGAPGVLFFHGNGENLETMRLAGTFEAIRELGVAWLAVDYPGYGRSTGQPSEESLSAAADAALAWAAVHWPSRPVAAVGWSMGAATAIGLAGRSADRLTALAALSPWTSLPDVARHHFPMPLLALIMSERYDSLAVAPSLDLPSLVIHGTRDAIIPVEQGRRLAEALPRARFLEIATAGHNDLLAHGAAWDALGELLASLQPPRQTGQSS